MQEYKLRYFNELGGREEINFAPEGNFSFDYFDVSAVRSGYRNTVSVTAKRDVELIKCTRRGVWKAEFGDLCFMNGYQSWTKTKEYFLSENERDVKKLPKPILNAFSFDRYGDATFFDYDKSLLHGYDLFYVKGKSGAFIINANYRSAYLIIVADRSTGEISLRSELDGLIIKSGETFTVIDYYLCEGYDEGLKLFDELFPKKPVKKILGYTSWYNYYQLVTEAIILRDLEGLDKRFDLFQIDDGYETFVGDWKDVDEKKFPNGLKGIADKIHEKGYLAGVWLAPFVAEEKSRVLREHPEWFDFNGERVKCGSNWSGFYALNIKKAGVKEYIADCLQYFIDLGFDFFKLDFLYAANLPVYKGYTRSQIAEEAYGFLREVLKGKIILGCGATLFNGADRFEYMRIGPDVSLKFDDVWFMRFMHNERISTMVTLQNTVYRSLFDGRLFGNDPDVFLLRDDNISMNKEQKRSLLTLNALFGSVLMTSDDIGRYDDEKRAALAQALELNRNAVVKKFDRVHDVIEVTYEMNGKTFSLKYNYKKGVIYDR